MSDLGDWGVTPPGHGEETVQLFETVFSHENGEVVVTPSGAGYMFGSPSKGMSQKDEDRVDQERLTEP